MLYNGAYGETAIELKQFLGFKKNNVTDLEMNEGFKTILNQINSYNKNSKANYQLNVANRLMVQNEFRILSDFSNSMKNDFYADIQSVDFENEGQTAVNEINQWIKTKTNNKIEKFFDEPLDPLTRLVIVNAVYFKG
jgi:serpin B